jgi:lipopolysaccharide export system protein LptC
MYKYLNNAKLYILSNSSRRLYWILIVILLIICCLSILSFKQNENTDQTVALLSPREIQSQLENLK